jgi:hypothetical protein
MVSCCRRAAFHEFVPIVFYIDVAFHDLPFSRTPQDLLHSLPPGLGRRQVQEGRVDDDCISPPPLISFDRLVDDGSVSPPPLILLEALDRPPVDDGSVSRQVQEGRVDDDCISPPPLISFDRLVDDGSVSPPPLILLEALDRPPVDDGSVSPPSLILLEEDTAE